MLTPICNSYQMRIQQAEETYLDLFRRRAIVRGFFELDPFYEQWINVGGLPVLASAKSILML